MFSLAGKSCIVTGGGSGIGTAIARRFIKSGALVLIADISDNRDLAVELGCEFRRTDVGQEGEMAALCQEAVRLFGKLDVMVNNAGIALGRALAEAEFEQPLRYWRVHTMGVTMGIKEAAARMTRGGSIINISSITALRGFAQWGEYAATKAGIISLTQTASVEFGPAGIRVNCIAPGIIDTPLAMSEAPDMIERNAAVFTQLGRIGRPEELAAAVHFMASDDASYITGQTLLVDGGWSTGTSLHGIQLALSTTS